MSDQCVSGVFGSLVWVLMTVSGNSNADAQGDYSLSLGKGYRFVRCNSVETVIEDSSGAIVFSPMDYQGIGPITHYCFTDNLLILKTAGREIRNSAVFEKPDFDKTYYFSIPSMGKVSGPFSKSDVERHLNLESVDVLPWKKPRITLPFVLGGGVLGIMVLGIAFLFVVAKRKRIGAPRSNGN